MAPIHLRFRASVNTCRAWAHVAHVAHVARLRGASTKEHIQRMMVSGNPVINRCMHPLAGGHVRCSITQRPVASANA